MLSITLYKEYTVSGVQTDQRRPLGGISVITLKADEDLHLGHDSLIGWTGEFKSYLCVALDRAQWSAECSYN